MAHEGGGNHAVGAKQKNGSQRDTRPAIEVPLERVRQIARHYGRERVDEGRNPLRICLSEESGRPPHGDEGHEAFPDEGVLQITGIYR